MRKLLDKLEMERLFRDQSFSTYIFEALVNFLELKTVVYIYKSHNFLFLLQSVEHNAEIA